MVQIEPCCSAAVRAAVVVVELRALILVERRNLRRAGQEFSPESCLAHVVEFLVLRFSAPHGLQGDSQSPVVVREVFLHYLAVPRPCGPSPRALRFGWREAELCTPVRFRFSLSCHSR